MCLPSGRAELRTPPPLMPQPRRPHGARPRDLWTRPGGARVCGSRPAAHYLARKDPRAAEGSRAHRRQRRRRRRRRGVPRAAAGDCGRLRESVGTPPGPDGARARSRPGAAALSLAAFRPRSPVSTGRETGFPSLCRGQHEPRADWAAGRGRRFVSRRA